MCTWTVGFLYSIYYTVKKHLFVWGFLWWLIKWSIQKREREREDWIGPEKLQSSNFFSLNRWRQAWSKPMTFANFKFCGWWVINYHTSRPHTAQCYKIQKKLQKKFVKSLVITIDFPNHSISNFGKNLKWNNIDLATGNYKYFNTNK